MQTSHGRSVAPPAAPHSPAATPAPPVRRVPEPSPPSRHGGWIALVILAVLAAGGYAAHRRYPGLVDRLLNRSRPAVVRGPRTVPVVVASAYLGNLPIYLDGLGNVTALNTVTVRSRVEGEIINVAFVEGQMVKQGDLLVEIDPRPYEVQLAQAEGQLAKDQAALNFARVDLQRYQAAPNTIVTPQQRDTAVAQVGQNEGLVKSDEAQIAAIRLQLSYCRITAPITGRIGLRMVDQGNLVHANDPSGLAVITQLEPITVVFSLPEDVLPQVLRAGASGKTLPVEAQNRDRTVRLATGTLLAMDNQVDPATLMVKLKAVFENKEHTLYPNQAVNARLLVDTRQNAVLIPANAIQRSPNGTPFVYVVHAGQHSSDKADVAGHGQRASGERSGEQGHAREHPGGRTAGSPPAEPTLEGDVDIRTVKVGPSEGDLVIAEAGLKPGDIVVTEGVDKLQPGSKVTGTWPHPATRPAAIAAATALATEPAATQLAHPEGRSSRSHEPGGSTQPAGRSRSRS